MSGYGRKIIGELKGHDLFAPESFPIQRDVVYVEENLEVPVNTLIKIIDGIATICTSVDLGFELIDSEVSRTAKSVKAINADMELAITITSKTAEDNNRSVPVFLTGAFIADALNLPEDLEVTKLKPILRKHNIYLHR